MIFAATSIANSGLNFVLGLLVARFLGPDEFGRYAIAMAIAVIVNTVLFEWLRLSATRFYSERTAREDASIRATLEFGFGALILVMVLLVGFGLLAGVDAGGLSPVLLAAAAASGVGLGLYEYHAALARARFASGTFARLATAKNVLYFALMVGGAFWFRDATIVVGGSALGAIGAVLAVRGLLADPGVRKFDHVDPRIARVFLGYAVPLVIASALYQMMPFLNRTWLASRDGFAEAGYFSLASDVGTRIVQTIGSALDIFLFQIAVRTEEASGRARAEEQITANLAVVVAVLLPCAAGFWAILPSVEALVVPAAYRGHFAAYAGLLIPALLAISIVQYALNPILQLRRRTAPAIAAATCGLAVNGAALVFLPEWLGPHRAALGQVIGSLAALAVLGGIVLTGRDRLPLPWRDLGLATIATGAMTLAITPLRSLESPVLALGAIVLAGAAVYGGLAWLGDIAGLRTAALGFLRRRTASAPAA
jgi:O-antigen/teichoic acid export membrane protein